MGTTKRISGDYTLQSVNPTDNININTNTVTINGNLIVAGQSTSVDSTNTTIWDNIITLNGGLSPGIAPTLNAGIEVDRGTLANVQLRWNESLTAWQITSDGTNYSNILTTTTGITANLDMKGYSIYSSTTGNVKFDANLTIQNVSSAPAALSGYNTVYAQTPAGGGSGLYVTNTTNQQQELVTKTKAIVYALIM